MRSAMSQLNLSERAHHRTQSVKLASTIADPRGLWKSVHLAEALQYWLKRAKAGADCPSFTKTDGQLTARKRPCQLVVNTRFGAVGWFFQTAPNLFSTFGDP